jgi:hypothetical protein
MKRVAVIMLAAIAGVAIGRCAAVAWVASQAGAGSTNGGGTYPRLVLLTKRCELGTVATGAPIEASFAIRNDGGRRLVVRREQGTCCGAMEQDGVIIVNPGCSTNLSVKIDTGGQWGRLEKAVTYTTNDPAFPLFELTVAADITKPIRVGDEGAARDES